MAERLKVRRLPGKHWAWCVMDKNGRILPLGVWLARFHKFEEAIAHADNAARAQGGGQDG